MIPPGFNRAGKGFSEICFWLLISESSTVNQQLCSLEREGWRQTLNKMKRGPVLLASPITCLGKSALCIWPFYWDHNAMSPSARTSPLLASLATHLHAVTQFNKVFSLGLSGRDTKVPLPPMDTCSFAVLAQDKAHGCCLLYISLIRPMLWVSCVSGQTVKLSYRQVSLSTHFKVHYSYA